MLICFCFRSSGTGGSPTPAAGSRLRSRPDGHHFAMGQARRDCESFPRSKNLRAEAREKYPRSLKMNDPGELGSPGVRVLRGFVAGLRQFTASLAVRSVEAAGPPGAQVAVELPPGSCPLPPKPIVVAIIVNMVPVFRALRPPCRSRACIQPRILLSGKRRSRLRQSAPAHRGNTLGTNRMDSIILASQSLSTSAKQRGPGRERSPEAENERRLVVATPVTIRCHSAQRTTRETDGALVTDQQRSPTKPARFYAVLCPRCHRSTFRVGRHGNLLEHQPGVMSVVFHASLPARDGALQ